MADNYTLLSQLVEHPALFGTYVLNQELKTNRFVQSGILTPDQQLGSQLSQPGSRIIIPFINDLTGDPDTWSDTKDIEANNLSTGKQQGIKFYQAKAYGYTEFGQMVSGAPVADTIGQRFAAFWNRADEKTLIAILQGVMANATIAAAKFYDQTAKTPTEPTFGAEGFLGAIGLMGDVQDTSLGAIAINSATYSLMKFQGLIDTIQPQGAVTPFEAYNGLRIVLDDDIPVDLTTPAKPTSTAYIFGSGAVSYSTAMQSTETKHDPLSKGGSDAIVQKRIGTIHVNGTSLVSSFAPADGVSPTLAELSASTTWEIVDGVDPRNIQVVAYKAQLDPDLTPGATSSTTSNSGSTTSNG